MSLIGGGEVSLAGGGEVTSPVRKWGFDVGQFFSEAWSVTSGHTAGER